MKLKRTPKECRLGNLRGQPKNLGPEEQRGQKGQIDRKNRSLPPGMQALINASQDKYSFWMIANA